jgi:hypothetical protein
MTESKAKIIKAITEIHHIFPQWEDKAIINQAYKDIGVSKNDFSEDFCPYPILSRVRFIRSLEKAIYTNDFSDIPTSIRISKAVNDNLPKLKEDFPNSEDVDILKMAYDMARGVLDNSDFETVDEEPVYFEIFVDDPEAFEEELKKQFAKQDDFDYNDWADFTDDRVDLGAVMKLKGDIIELMDEIVDLDLKIQKLDSPAERNKLYPKLISKKEEYNKLSNELKQIEKSSGMTFDFTDDAAKAKFFAKDKPVTSSNVAEIGYERGKLRIFFKNGGGYEYPVPSSWYTEMLNASSKGSFVWETLRGKTPGRVIDNPNKITPGGVGGSIVPYFKIKQAAMEPDAMRKSVRGFLKAASKGKGEVSGQPIRKIPKPEYKAFKRFLKKGVLKFTPESTPKAKKPSSRKSTAPRQFKKIVKKLISKKGKSEKPKETPEGQDKTAVRELIKRIKKALKNARKNKLDDVVINALENRIKTLEKSISDFSRENKEINYYNIVDDFSDDMRYFSGPITRAGEFEYNEGTKFKTIDNLNKVSSEYLHLPAFDSHNENQIIGFGYNLTDDPDKYLKNHPKYELFKKEDYIFSEGYTFNDIEEIADISLDSDTKLPVSIRFLDENEGTENPEQLITDFIHLAISVNQTDLDRCSSSGGNPCYVQFRDRQDFVDKKNLEQKTVGDLMPEDKEKKKEKKPPKKDKDEEEDKEDEEKKGNSDQTKEDKDKSEKTEDFIPPKTENLIQIDKSVLEDLSKQVSDMAKVHNENLKRAEKLERDNIISDFNDNKQVYRIKSDFFETADLATVKVLKSALVKVNEEVDAQKQLFNSDFNIKADDFQKRLQSQYNVHGGKK